MDTKTILVLSIVANVVLAILLFFKSALNEILVHWWRERRAAKQDRDDAILRTYMSVLPAATHALTIMSFNLILTRGNPLPTGRALVEAHQQQAWVQFGRAIKTINDSLPRLPLELQRRVTEDLGQVFKLFTDRMVPENEAEFWRAYQDIYSKAAEIRTHMRGRYLKGRVAF